MDKKEYIERSAFDRDLQNLVKEYNRNCESDKSSGAFEALYRLRLAPAADVVEVVRCKDCEHYFCDTPYCKKHKVGYCAFDEIVKDKNHFCSYGERKEATP